MQNKTKKPLPKVKKVRLWIYQTDVSGNVNSHFDLMELPIKSTKKDVHKEVRRFLHHCYNIQDLGVFESKIGDRDFPTKSFLRNKS